MKTKFAFLVTLIVIVISISVKIKDVDTFGMLNIGNRPTITDQGQRRIEVHILDYEGDLYNQELKMFLIDYIRPEQVFNSREDLVKQITEDEKNCRSILLPLD